VLRDDPVTAALLHADAFVGPAIGVAATRVSFAAQATFHGHIALLVWRREEVATALPADLELAANRSPTPELHPVLLILGEQTQGAWILADRTLPLGLRYQEVAVAIPFVKHRRGRYLHTHVPRMFSSSPSAIWNGNASYGLGKRMAALTSRGAFRILTDEGGKALLHMVVEPRGDWTGLSDDACAPLRAIRDAVTLPIVGRTVAGTYVTSYFEWNFDAAVVRPAACGLSIDGPLAEGLGPRWCRAEPGCAFEVRGMTWRLSWPVPSRF
jgi:hypothetical protein